MNLYKIQISTRMLWAITLIVGVFVYVNTRQIVPNDFWWHMAIGREIISNQQIPTTDIYSFTMLGEPYLSYQMFWLMDVWYYLLFLIGGAELIIFLQSLIITGTYYIVLLLCWKESKSWGMTTLCIFFAITMGIYTWNVRPQALSFLLGTLFLYTIYMYRQQPRPAWLVVFPVGMLVWSNSHGSFIIGLVLIGIWFLDELWQIIVVKVPHQKRDTRRLLAPGISLVLSLGVSLIKPIGFKIFEYIQIMLTNPVNQTQVQEWLPPTLNDPIGPIFYGGLLFTAVLLAVSPRRPTFFQMALFLSFAILGLRMTRGVIWFGLILAPVWADHLSEIAVNYRKESKPRKNLTILNFGILGILFLLGSASLPWLRGSLPIAGVQKSLINAETPIAATEFLLSEKPDGKLFNDMGFGSYLIWAAHDDYQVFADPRVELFDPAIWNDYILISQAFPGWEERLEYYGVNLLMLSTSNQSALIASLEDAADWLLLYEDDAASIFARVN